MEPQLTTRPRMVFLSSGGILGDSVLRCLLASERFNVVGIVRSRRVMLRRAGFLRGAAAYFRRCGVFYTVYIWAITTLAEFLGLFTGTASISSRAKRHGIAICHTRDINDAPGRAFITSCRADLLVSAHFDQKLYPPLCDSSAMACLNIHPSLLPNHRGLEPVLHTMLLEQGSTFGVTVHRVAEDIDSGQTLARAIHQPDRKDSLLRVTRDLMVEGARLLIENVHQATLPRQTEHQPATGQPHSWPEAHQIRQLLRQGQHLIHVRDLPLFWQAH